MTIVEDAALDAPAPVLAWWRLLLRDPAALIAALVLLIIVLCAITAPLIAPHDPYASSRAVMPATGLGRTR